MRRRRTLSRRIRNEPPALSGVRRIGPASSPFGCGNTHLLGDARVDNGPLTMGMDATGARLLAARIAAGVRIGAVIELVADSGSDLRAGDRGVVREFDATGAVVVEWDRGFDSAIDPRITPFRALAA